MSMDVQPRTPVDDTDVLRVEHIAKRFGALTALHDVNMRLNKGEVLGLIGDNGAGKSTLMKIICGYHRPTPDGSSSTARRSRCARSTTPARSASTPCTRIWRWSTNSASTTTCSSTGNRSDGRSCTTG